MASDISPAAAQSRAARVLAALTVAALLSTTSLAFADQERVYVWKDRDGTVRFTTTPPAPQASRVEVQKTVPLKGS